MIATGGATLNPVVMKQSDIIKSAYSLTLDAILDDSNKGREDNPYLLRLRADLGASYEAIRKRETKRRYICAGGFADI